MASQTTSGEASLTYSGHNISDAEYQASGLRRLLPERAVRTLGGLYIFTSLVAGFATADMSTGDLVWRDNEVGVHLLAENYNDSTDKASVVFAGWGVKDGRRIAEALNPALSKIGPVLYASYPDSGFGNDSQVYRALAEDITIEMQELGKTSLAIDAQSMGAAILFKVLPFIPENITIDTLILDCSPSSIQDVRYKDTLEVLSPFRHYHFGFFSAIIGTILHNIMVDNPSSGLVHELKEGVRIGATGTDPELMKEQLLVLMSFKPDPLLLERLKDTRIALARPENPGNDSVVDVDLAEKGWEEYFGRPVEVILIPNGEHASPTTRPGEYIKAFTASSIFSTVLEPGKYISIPNNITVPPA